MNDVLLGLLIPFIGTSAGALSIVGAAALAGLCVWIAGA